VNGLGEITLIFLAWQIGIIFRFGIRLAYALDEIGEFFAELLDNFCHVVLPYEDYF
jgi:hypothetical protein